MNILKSISKGFKVLALTVLAFSAMFGVGTARSNEIITAVTAQSSDLSPFYANEGVQLITVTTVTGSGSVVTDFGTGVLAWLELVLDMVVNAFAGVIAVFWTADYGFSIYGLLMLFGLAVGFVGLALGFIRGLIQK